MPKFYGQNKKRIDPRYFLNETANRGDMDNDGDVDSQDVVDVAKKVAQKQGDSGGRTDFDQLEYDLEALFDTGEVQNDKKAIDNVNAMIAKVGKASGGRSAALHPEDVVPATEYEIEELVKASKEGRLYPEVARLLDKTRRGQLEVPPNMPGDDVAINRQMYGSDYHPNDPRSPGYSRNA